MCYRSRRDLPRKGYGRKANRETQFNGLILVPSDGCDIVLAITIVLVQASPRRPLSALRKASVAFPCWREWDSADPASSSS